MYQDGFGRLILIQLTVFLLSIAANYSSLIKTYKKQ